MKSETEIGDPLVLPARVVERWHAFEQVRVQLPEVGLSFTDFCRHLDGLGYRHTLPRHLAAVYLCASCIQGNRRAIEILEEDYIAAIRGRAQRWVRQACLVDDALQRVRERLLVGSPPHVAKYKGEGGLKAWLSVIAANAIRDELRAQRQQAARHRAFVTSARLEEEFCLPSAEEGELHNYALRLDAFLVDAVGELSADDRRLLRMRYVDGLSIDEVARRRARHRSSAARSIGRSERRLRAHLYRLITAHLDPREADEIIACLPRLGSRLSLCVETILGSA